MSQNSPYRNRKTQYVIAIVCIVFCGTTLVLWRHGRNSGQREPDQVSFENGESEVTGTERDDMTPELPVVAEGKQEPSASTETATVDDPHLDKLISSLSYPQLKEDEVPLDLTPGQTDPRALQAALQLWENFRNVETVTFSFENAYADPAQKDDGSTGVVHFQKPFFLRKEGRGEKIAFRYVTNGVFQRRIIRTRNRPDFQEYEREDPDDAELENFLSQGMQVNIASLVLLMCPPSSFTSLGKEQWQGKDCLKIKSNGMVFWVDQDGSQIQRVQLLRRGGYVLQEWRNFKYEKVKFATTKDGAETQHEFLFPSKFDIVTTGESHEQIVRHRTIQDVKVNVDIPPSKFDLRSETLKTDDLWTEEF